MTVTTNSFNLIGVVEDREVSLDCVSKESRFTVVHVKKARMLEIKVTRL